jgi:hypothetical protein
MKKMIETSMRKTIITLLISIAYGMFAYFSLNAFFEYNKELTGYNQLVSWSKELPMPTITVCPQDIFKNVSNETTAEMILQNLNDYVYKWGDLFDETMMSNPHNLWDSKHVIFSNWLGQCYSLKSNTNATANNWQGYLIYLPVGKKYKVSMNFMSIHTSLDGS